MRPAEVAVQYVRCDEAPAPGPWLAESELAELARWHAQQRRVQFLAGRLAAKELVRELLGQSSVELAAIEIRSQDGRGRGVQPALRVAGQPGPFRLSIAHTARGAVAAASLRPAWGIGVDLVPRDLEARNLARAWFTPAEVQWLAGGRGYGPAAIWAAKEAAYKAAGGGEPFRPRCIQIYPLAGGRLAARLHGPTAGPLVEIYIEALDGHLAAVALAVPVPAPQGAGGGHHD